MGGHPLDNAVWAALRGPHAGLAESHGSAARYPPDVAPFAAIPDRPDELAWADLASFGDAVLFRPVVEPPTGWTILGGGAGVQLVADALEGVDDPSAERLGIEHAGEMMALVALTRPGPFSLRTPLLGTYLGVRDSAGALVAMAGERLHLPGWTEISAVCTDPAARGRGLATRLVRAVAAGIVARGETPFLHAAATNHSAIRLYLALGFAHRSDVRFVVLRPPESSAGAPDA